MKPPRVYKCVRCGVRRCAKSKSVCAVCSERGATEIDPRAGYGFEETQRR
jgi:hypothetical protein